jgi:cytochrome c-type biogenesis protein
MIVLPCTLPLAFVIVPLSLGKGMKKGLGLASAFGLGVAIMLSLYGVIAAAVGEVAIGSLGAPLESVKNWLYFIAGIFAYLFAIGEIGLWRLRMPSYTGAAPAFIQRRGDYLKALLLGLFLGNIGVGCPHPATPVILTRIAASGDIFYGWMLFLVHAIGRVLPLLLLAFLAILGVNALTWLVERKAKIERATGWAMVFVAAFILVLGLFSHDWWVNSGQHTLLEELTQEERLVALIAQRLGVQSPHRHGLEEGEGLFGLPLAWGNWTLVFLWIVPFWWHYFKKRKEIATLSEEDERRKEIAKMPLRLGFTLATSLLLIVTFVYYLPLRFEHQASEKPIAMPEGIIHMEEGQAGHGAARYHEESEIKEGLAVNLNLTPVPIFVGTSTRLDFFVNEKPRVRALSISELELDHTKYMHVIGIRNDMEEFFHVHPNPGGREGLWTAEHIFSKPGLYKIWSEIRKDGITHAFGHPEFSIEGPGEPYQKQVSLARNIIVRDYQVSLELEEPVAKGHEHELTFDVHTLSGKEVVLEDYLAAKIHLTVIKDDWSEFIHTHPEEGEHHGFKVLREALANGGGHDTSEEEHGVNFHVTFQEAGLYKVFAQLRPQGINLPPDEALTASFWIKVEEKAPGFVPGWWRNLIVSLLLIIILSWLVARYLKVSIV